MLQMFFIQIQQVIITAKNVVKLFNGCAFFFGNGGKPLTNFCFVLQGEFEVLGKEADHCGWQISGSFSFCTLIGLAKFFIKKLRPIVCKFGLVVIFAPLTTTSTQK